MPLYQTSVEQSFLKALGPHRIATSGQQRARNVTPRTMTYSSSVVVGETIRYGESSGAPRPEFDEADLGQEVLIQD